MKIRTKRLLYLLAVTLILVTLAGCSPSTTEPAPGPQPPSLDLPEKLTLAAAGTEPTALATTLADILTRNTPMEVSVEGVRSNAEAHRLLADTAGILNITVDGGCVPCHRVAVWSVAQGHYDATTFSIAGTVGIIGPDRGNLRALLCGAGPDSSELLAIQTTTTSGIKTVADLKGKRVYAENRNVLFIAPIMDAILEANGLTRDDIDWQSFTNGDDAFDELAAGKVDAVFYIFTDGSAKLAKSEELYVVPLSQETQKAVEATGYGFMAADWPEGRLPGTLTTPILGSPYVIWTSAELSDDVAYTLVSTVFENLGELQSSRELAAGFTPENVLAQWSFPYHPGAIRYFKETGLWKTDMDQQQAALLEKWSKG